MTYEKAHRNLFLIFLAVVVFVLCSCQTAKNLPRHNDRFPLAAAEYAAKKFPVKEVKGTPVIDSSKRADNKDFTGLIDSIWGMVEYPIWFKEDTPTIVHPVWNIGDTFTIRHTNETSKLISKLKTEYKPCKPDSIYISTTNWLLDGAAIEAANIKAANEKTGREKAEKDRDEWKTKAKVRFWMFIASVSLLLLLVGITVGKYLKRIPV